MTRSVTLFAALLALSPINAQEASTQLAMAVKPSSSAYAVVPFGAGEVLAFDVKVGPFSVGTGRMEVLGTEMVRGREAWHARLVVSGGALGIKVNDRIESWFDARSLHSLRYVQKLEERGKSRERRYEIFPERAEYSDARHDTASASVSDPLDDAAFIYFVRTLPLEVGATYEFNRYFKVDRNPVSVRVVRRERITVPAGTFETIVLQPVIKSKGLFAEGGEAEIWLSDDSRRLVVQLKTKLGPSTLTLRLRGSDAGQALVSASPTASGTP